MKEWNELTPKQQEIAKEYHRVLLLEDALRVLFAFYGSEVGTADIIIPPPPPPPPDDKPKP